ncbi:MAG: ATP-binding protein, partial [Pseudomonadota bacterium]
AGLHQILMNVVTNAIDAAPKRTGIITVATGFDVDAGRYVVRVSDNGPGMTPAARSRAFEPFHSTKGQRGTGLGLAVTKKIVEQHGGTVRLESAPDDGTTVHISMPATRPDLNPNETQQPTGRPGMDWGEDF